MFRLWCKNKQEWEKDAWAILPSGAIIELKSMKFINKKNHILEQWTGKTDVENKPIFEGDLVVQKKYPFYGDEEYSELNYIGEVFKYEGSGAYGVALHQVSDRVRGAALGSFWEDYQELIVIGNIHENAELLEVV